MVLVGVDRVERVRTDTSSPRREIFQKLEDSCEQHLATSVDDVLRVGPDFNFFACPTIISDLSIGLSLTDDERYLAQLGAFVRRFGADRWREVRYDDQLWVPFLMASLAGLFDAHHDDLEPDDRDLLRDGIADMAGVLHHELATQKWGRRERTIWNHTIVGFAALGIAGLVLDTHPASGEWLDIGIDRCRVFFDIGLTPAGMTWEGLKYCGFVFKHVGMLLQGLDRIGRRAAMVPEGSDHERRLRRVPVWYAHEVFPGGSHLQNYNDSEWDPHPALWGFLSTFAPYEPDLCAVVWDRLVGRRGRRTYGAHPRWSSLAEAICFFPEPYDDTVLEQLEHEFSCSDVGYLSARDGWDANASVFTFNSGPFSAKIHDQSDNNSFTFIAGGVPLVLDAGSANRRTEGTPSSSLGHNLVFIDGRAEDVAGQGHGVSGRILAVERQDSYVAVVGDASESYGKDGYNPVRHALRHAVFVRHPTPYLITYDDIQKDDADHDYEYVVHVPVALGPTPRGTRFAIVGAAEGPVGHIEFLHPRTLTATSEPYRSRCDPYRRHDLWRFQTRANNPHFMVLLTSRDLQARPAVTFVLTDARAELRLSWPWGVDEIRCERSEQSEQQAASFTRTAGA